MEKDYPIIDIPVGAEFPSCCEEESCCCGSTAKSEKEILIEYLYLDLNSCDRCVGTDKILDKVVEGLRPALELAGYHIEYRKQEISTRELAEKYRFLSSPTILVNGMDVFGEAIETDCDCCGDIAGVQVDCRAYADGGQILEVPTQEMLTDAVLRAIYNPPCCSCSEYELPDNLKRFFDGKESKAAEME